MASKRLLEPVRGLANACARSRHASQPFLARSITTTTETIPSQASTDAALASPTLTNTTQATTHVPPPNPFLTPALTTLHSFPTLEPTAYTTYPPSALLLPLRRDILHRAVVFEGDKTRQGTASTKYRTEVHGSNRKIRPQKGLGKARLGDKKSPMLKGGGVAFGPKPRDFSTELQRKVYDLAWRTALSYRYRRGELVVVGGEAEIERQGPGSARWVRDLLKWHSWGNADGRTLFVTLAERANLKAALEAPRMGREARVLSVDEVDVKDLLELGRVVIEKAALEEILERHSSDLKSKVELVA